VFKLQAAENTTREMLALLAAGLVESVKASEALLPEVAVADSAPTSRSTNGIRHFRTFLLGHASQLSSRHIRNP
jgi:hypothetical protein